MTTKSGNSKFRVQRIRGDITWIMPRSLVAALFLKLTFEFSYFHSYTHSWRHQNGKQRNGSTKTTPCFSDFFKHQLVYFL